LKAWTGSAGLSGCTRGLPLAALSAAFSFSAGALTLAAASAFGLTLTLDGVFTAGLVSMASVFGFAASVGATGASPFAAFLASRSRFSFRNTLSSVSVVWPESGAE
jgi:hypothetical protein